MMELNRRSFLRLSAAGAATAALPPSLSAGRVASELEVARAAMPSPALTSKETVCQGKPFSGRVTCDGRPMPGIVVTNGRDSVKTNEKGEYVLTEFPKARFISVTVPSGYATSWFYVDAWARLGGFDFQLERNRLTGGKGCSFVHISDSEIKAAEYAGFWMDLRDLAARNDCAFVVHTGDICGRRGLLAHAQVMNDLSMGRRMVYCLGNHDAVSAWPWGEAEFEAVYGPSWYSFECGGVHFLVTPMNPSNCDRVPSYDEDQVADWIRGDLALTDPKMPVVLLNHFLPNADDRTKAGLIYGEKRPLDLRKACNYRGVVFGHTHNTWFRRREGIAFVNTTNPQIGGIDHSPNCARVVSVSETGEVTSRSYFGKMLEMKGERAGAVWETQLPAHTLRGGLLDGGKVLYVATNDDDGRGTAFVCALAKGDGKAVWKTKVGNTIKGRLALACGKVIGTDVEGVVTALDAASGAICWQVAIDGNEINGRKQMVAVGTVASPDGRRVVAGAGRYQSVLDAETGKLLWHGNGSYEGEPISISPGYAPGYIVTPQNWRPSVCVAEETGKTLWSFDKVRFPGASPLLCGDKVILADENTLYEMELKTGKVIRSRQYSFNFSVPGDFAETDRLYLKGVQDKGLVALDRNSLEVVWQASVGKGLIGQSAYVGVGRTALTTTPAVIGDKTVCASGADGTIGFWNLSDGKKVREIKTGVPYVASVVVSDGRVFATDLSGMVRAFEIGL